VIKKSITHAPILPIGAEFFGPLSWCIQFRELDHSLITNQAISAAIVLRPS
jgi:hypothetical protein